MFRNFAGVMEHNVESIQNKIYEIRGQRVMLDFDLANAYGVETSQLKRQVRRNIERFEGDDFMFEVTRDELSRCQIGTLDIKRGQNSPCEHEGEGLGVRLKKGSSCSLFLLSYLLSR